MWSPADLCILVPMLGRPHTVEPLLDSIHEATPTARVLFLVSPEDVEVHDAIDRTGKPRMTVPWRPAGDYSRKINEGYRATTEALLFTGACDIRFHPGWFETCLARLSPQIGVVGTNDLCNKRTRLRHSTHSLVTREYADRGTIDEPRTIYHEGYPHELCDDELVETAKRRGAYAHARDAHVEHLHPMNGGAPMDELYAQQGERILAGRALFRERRRLWM